MRLLFVTPYYVPDLQFGGPPQKIHALARGLAGRGHKVRVVTFDHGSSDSCEALEIDGVAVQHVPWIGTGLRQCPIAPSLVRQQVASVELVHCYGIYNLICPFVTYLARRHRIPIVLEPLGMYPPRARNRIVKSVYNALLTRWMVRRAAAVIGASAAECRDLESIPRTVKPVCRRNGIDVSAFADLPSGAGLRECWNVAPDEKLILFIGRISPVKNLEQLVRAFGHANLRRARLVLIGPAEEPGYEARLRALFSETGLNGRVLLAGPLYEDDQRAALAAADLFVLPSLSESFGNAAAEAVAAGLPVLLTDTCGVAPIIHGRAGLAVPLGIESLAAGLATMIGEPNQRKQLTARQAEVIRELSWDEPIEQTERLYAEILAGRPPGV